MSSISVQFDHRQQQSLSPRLQHAVRLLQLSSMDFAQAVHDALGKNPFLEADESDGESADGADSAALEALAEMPTASEAADSVVADSAPLTDEAFASDAVTAEYDSVDSDSDDAERENWQADGSNTRRNEDGEMTAMDAMVAQTSLSSHLHGQLNVLVLPLRDMVLAKVIVESLDDDGYLRTPLAELVDLAELDPPATLEDLQIALRRVQSLEPAGIGARDVAECLQLQLADIACPDARELARTIVTAHLHSLAAKDISGLARQLSRTPAEIEAVCERIRRLDPHPGWRFGGAPVQYVTPDVIVKKVRGAWSVQLNPVIAPRVRLNSVYAEMFQRHRKAHGPKPDADGKVSASADSTDRSGDKEMAAQLQEARWTVRNIEQRFATILSVAQAIVKRQKHFLDYGALAMKPLGLREIADEVGLHESTVSRVTNNKYMATPLGVFELKYFFSRAMVTASGGACSATAIRGLIQDMIAAENRSAPLSDAEIARQLAKQGLVVARRTVTKYRQVLKIEAVERRRAHS